MCGVVNNTKLGVWSFGTIYALHLEISYSTEWVSICETGHWHYSVLYLVFTMIIPHEMTDLYLFLPSAQSGVGACV